MAKFTAKELIPPGVEIRTKLETTENIEYMGSGNIRSLVRIWNSIHKQLRRSLKKDRNQTTITEITKVSGIIWYLRGLANKVPPKPVFPTLRKRQYFKEDANVAFFDKNHMWESAVIIHIPDNKEPDYIVEFRNGKRFFNPNSPLIMNKWELEYLKANNPYFQVWAKNTNGFLIPDKMKATFR